jgi:hypothetical protein
VRAAEKEDAAEFSLGPIAFHERCPRLSAWMRQLEQMPGYERTYPPHWGSSPLSGRSPVSPLE